MVVKELITELLNCDMKSKIELKTINVDKCGVAHLYDVHSIDKTVVYDQEQNTFITTILFKNYDFERESEE